MTVFFKQSVIDSWPGCAEKRTNKIYENK